MVSVSHDRTVWMISTIVEGTEDEAQAAQAAIEKALCPDPDHLGYCAVPWTTLATRFDDLDPNERAAWQADFNADRQRARQHGEPGT
jgi:hypothetical protein